MPGELRDILHVRRLRLLGEIPDPHILDHPLAQWGHDALLRNGVATIATPERVTIAECGEDWRISGGPSG